MLACISSIISGVIPAPNPPRPPRPPAPPPPLGLNPPPPPAAFGLNPPPPAPAAPPAAFGLNPPPPAAAPPPAALFVLAGKIAARFLAFAVFADLICSFCLSVSLISSCTAG